MRLKRVFALCRRMLRYFKQEDMYLSAMALGMNSYVDIENDKHMLFVDYDIKDYGRVHNSIKDLQGFWSLSHAFVYATAKGYHAFFFYDNDLPYSRIKMILDYAKDIDPMYRFISRLYDHKTIRVAGKYKEQDIKFHSVVKGRTPTADEILVADAKRKEYSLLKQMHDNFRKECLVEYEL
jgi:hypothetical protein